MTPLAEHALRPLPSGWSRGVYPGQYARLDGTAHVSRVGRERWLARVNGERVGVLRTAELAMSYADLRAAGNVW